MLTDVGGQDSLAVPAEVLRVDRRKVAAALPSSQPGRRRIVPFVILQGPLPKRNLLSLLLVGRLVDSSVVSGAERHLVTSLDLPCRNAVDFVTTQGSVVLLLLDLLVSVEVRLSILLLLLHFSHGLTLIIFRIDRY